MQLGSRALFCQTNTIPSHRCQRNRATRGTNQQRAKTYLADQAKRRMCEFHSKFPKLAERLNRHCNSSRAGSSSKQPSRSPEFNSFELKPQKLLAFFISMIRFDDARDAMTIGNLGGGNGRSPQDDNSSGDNKTCTGNGNHRECNKKMANDNQ